MRARGGLAVRPRQHAAQRVARRLRRHRPRDDRLHRARTRGLRRPTPTRCAATTGCATARRCSAWCATTACARRTSCTTRTCCPGSRSACTATRTTWLRCSACAGSKFILTNAPRAYAERVLGALGIARWFDGVIAIEDMHMFGQLRPKPDARMLRRLVARLRVPAVALRAGGRHAGAPEGGAQRRACRRCGCSAGCAGRRPCRAARRGMRCGRPTSTGGCAGSAICCAEPPPRR